MKETVSYNIRVYNDGMMMPLFGYIITDTGLEREGGGQKERGRKRKGKREKERLVIE